MNDNLLYFFGRGSVFTEKHNSAFFINDDELVLLDCSDYTFQQIRTNKVDLSNIKKIYVLITHTHGDHINGLDILIEYMWFVLHIPVIVVVPSISLLTDIVYILNILGCSKSWYSIIYCNNLKKEWFISSIRTEHVDQLRFCFGYNLNINGKNVVYTGDTVTLDPYIKYLSKDSYLYTECSYNDSGVHLYINDVLDKLIQLSENNVHVYLMHLDNEEKISEMIKDTCIKLAPLYND